MLRPRVLLPPYLFPLLFFLVCFVFFFVNGLHLHSHSHLHRINNLFIVQFKTLENYFWIFDSVIVGRCRFCRRHRRRVPLAVALLANYMSRRNQPNIYMYI